MLRDNGAWCRLEVDENFFVHIGRNQDMYVGSFEPCGDAVARVHSLGLFAEPIDRSPWDPHLAELEVLRPADDAFRAEVERLVDEGGKVVLEETHVANAARWHYPEPGQVAETRAGLTPRARLSVERETYTPECRSELLLEAVLPDDDGVVRVRWSV